MAFNYEFTQEADKTFTIKDFQLIKAGMWFGHNAEDGLRVGDAELQSIMDASEKFHHLIQPLLRYKHPVQGGGREILGFLSKFKRAGDTIVADIKGMTADIFTQFKEGKLGRQSAMVRREWTEPTTQTPVAMMIPAVDLVGGAMPAVNSLLGPVSFSADESGDISLLTYKPLEKTTGQIALSGFEQAAVADNKTEVATMTNPDESGRLAQIESREAKIEAGETALKESKEAHEVAMVEGANKIHEDGVKAFMSNWMKKIPPADVESTEKIMLALRDDPYMAFCESIKSRPDVEAKKTKGSGPGSGEDETPAEEKIIAMAEDLADKKDISFGDAVATLKVGKEMEADYRKPYAGVPDPLK